MSILSRLFGRRKITDMSLTELRTEEKKLEIKEQQLLNKIDKYEKLKQDTFNRGAKISSPEMRRIYARKFSEYSKLAQIYETELIRVSKELATVTIIRTIMERRKGKKEKPLLANLSDKDIAKIQVMLEDDKVSREVYMDQINEIFGAVTDEALQVSADVGKEGDSIMKIWEKMDEGGLDFDSAYKEASGKKEKQKEGEAT